jgi:hypothetical protein
LIPGEQIPCGNKFSVEHRAKKENPSTRLLIPKENSVVNRFRNGFLHFIPLPPPEGVVRQFMGVLNVSDCYFAEASLAMALSMESQSRFRLRRRCVLDYQK